MKNKILIIVTGISLTLYSSEEHTIHPHYVWFDLAAVVIKEDGIYADSNKGLFKLNVIEYDSTTNQYKVLCRCREDSDLNPTSALQAFEENLP